MLQLTNPTLLKIKKQRYPAIDGPYNLTQMNSNDFALAVYWIYRTEIKSGTWTSSFDDVAIMKATRDAGRDCVLYQSGEMKGAIQCKHTISMTSMNIEAFLREFTKFILYSIAIPEKVTLSAGFKYYVASSSGFDEDLINLMNEGLAIANHSKFQKYTEENIKKFTGLNHLIYSDIKQQILDAIALIKLERIDGSDINKLLHEPKHNPVVKAFFNAKQVVDEQTADELKQGIRELKQDICELKDDRKQKIATPPSQLPLPLLRLPRAVSSPEDKVEDIFTEKEISLLDCMSKYKRIAFLGWGLSGKSVELAYAAHYLSARETLNHVFLIDMGFYKGQDIHKLIPDFELRNSNDVVLFLDGLDEVPTGHYRTALDSIELFSTNYPEVRMIVSCRINIYTEDENPQYSTLPGFTVIKLKDLSHKAIVQYLNSLTGIVIDDFYKKVYDAKVENLIHTPYYLINFASRFLTSGNIYKDKGELFEDTINKAIKEDVARYYKENAVEKRKEARISLEKLSFITEAQGKNVFTSDELESLFSKETAKLILGMGQLVKGDAAKGIWNFFHHNIQEYLMAKILSNYEYAKIEHLLVASNTTKTIKPSMINTISFLVGLVGKTSATRNKLIDLLSVSEPALLMKFEAGYLDDNFREKVFQRIFNYYKQAKRGINPRRFNLRELAAFSQTEGNADFLLTEVENAASETDVANALDILLFYDLAEFPVQFQTLEDLITKSIASCNDDMKFKMFMILILQKTYDCNTYQFIFNELKDNPYTHLRALLFTGINKFDLGMHYRDYIIAQTLMLVTEEWNKFASANGMQRSGTESQMLREIIKKLKDVESVKLKLKLIQKHFRAFNHSIDFRKFIPSTLTQAEQYPKDTATLNLVTSIYTANIEVISIDARPNNTWVKYFAAVGKRLHACKSLVKKQGGINYRIAEAIAALCDDQCIRYFAKQVSIGKISVADADILQWRIGNLNLDMAKSFNKALDPSINLPLPKVVDFPKLAAEEFKKKAGVLFTTGQLLAEAENLFQVSGKSSLRHEDLYQIQPADHRLNQYFYWLFHCFDFKATRTRIYSAQEVQTFELANEEALFPSRIYDLIKDMPNGELNTSQIGVVKDWCLTIENSLNFSKEPVNSNYRIIKYADEELFVYFIRKFNLTGFQKTTYLNMLSFYDSHGRNEKLYAFILPFIGLTDLKARVLKNLADKKISQQVLPDHVDFVVKYECKTARKSLLAYLKMDHIYKWEEILSAYFALDGDPENLYPLLSTDDQTNVHHLFGKLKQVDPGKLLMEMKAIFQTATSAKKKQLTGYLIQLGDLDALSFYVQLLKAALKLPEIFSVHTDINVGYTKAFAKTALELFEFAFLSPFKSNYAYNPFAVALNVLRSIALDFQHYPEFRAQVSSYIDQLKVDQPLDFVNMAEYLETTMEEWDYIYMQNNISILDFKQAKESFEAINGR